MEKSGGLQPAAASNSTRKMNLIDLGRQVDNRLTAFGPDLIALRRHLHQNPELSGSESHTTAEIARRLSAANIPHTVAQSGHGLITDVVTAPEPKRPVVALRADLDALPIQEENQVPYCSIHPGVMHACGHDAHTAILLATTLALHQSSPFPVGWRSIFQPSEEVGKGAGEMIEQGALRGVDAVVALHVDPNLDIGQVGVTPGPRSAFCQDLEIVVRGRGGHGARPHLTVDPIAVAAHLITVLYQAVPRHTDTRKPVVVTIGKIQGGHAANVIPDTVHLKGTIRALESTVIQETQAFVDQVCRGVAESFGALITPAYDAVLPGVTNDATISLACTKAAANVFGPDKIIQDLPPSLGAEDFADYLQVVPGCMMNLGVKTPGGPVRPLHTSRFDLDEDALLLGAKLLARVLLTWPEQTPSRAKPSNSATTT
jgi:amidohydrolase